MKKIFLIIPMLSVGGAERVCANLAAVLNKDLFSPTIISLYSKETKSAVYNELLKKVPVLYLNKKRGCDFSLLFKLRKLIKKEEPDIIHTHIGAFMYAVLACLFLSIRSVKIHTVHTVAQCEFGKLQKLIAFVGYHFSNWKPIAISDTVKQSIHAVYRLPLERIYRIYNGVNLSDFSTHIMEPTNTFTFISVGRLSPEKNHFLLLKAFKRLQDEIQDIKIIFVGEGVSLANLKKYTNEEGIQHRVSFVGVTNNVNTYLRKSDIFLLASKYEGFGLVVVEAMAAGLPCICTRSGGVEEIIQNNVNGILVDDFSIDSFYNKMKEVYFSKSLRESLSQNALLRAQDFTLDKMIELYESFYNHSYK